MPNQIKNLSGLQGLRQKPAMYLGSSDSDGMFTALREVLDNAVDEIFSQRNKSVFLARDTSKPNAFWVWDEGKGIPVTTMTVENPVTHTKEKVSVLQAVVALSHTGSKFDVSDADGQRGTHGVGIKISNAVSNRFEVYTFQGEWYQIVYEKGRPVTKVSKCKAPKDPVTGKPLKKGVLVYCDFDASVFDKGSKITEQYVETWFDTSACFCPAGSYFAYHNGEEWKEWQAEGAPAYLAGMVKKAKATVVSEDATLTLRGKFWDLAMAFTNYDGAGLQGFSNGLPNPEGGTHVTTAYTVVSKVLATYAKRGQSFTPSDFRDGMLGAINVRLTGCKFHNQAKSKLVDERASEPMAEEMYPLVEAFFAKHKALAATLCDRASALASLKQDFQQSKRVLKTLREAKKKGTLPTKLVASLNCTNEERELYLVEGDGAGGSAKMARDSNYQEVLPLKGKIPNAYRIADAIENDEVLNLLTAVGYDPSLEEPFKNLRVGKVIILADSDVDGLHIQNLVIAALVRFVPQLINEGRVYFVLPYEFMVHHKGKWNFAGTIAELKAMVPESAHKSFMHLKGLGEVDAAVLADMAFDPASRRLIRLEPLDKKTHKRIAELAGSDTSFRKELLGV